MRYPSSTGALSVLDGGAIRARRMRYPSKTLHNTKKPKALPWAFCFIFFGRICYFFAGVLAAGFGSALMSTSSTVKTSVL